MAWPKKIGKAAEWNRSNNSFGSLRQLGHPTLGLHLGSASNHYGTNGFECQSYQTRYWLDSSQPYSFMMFLSDTVHHSVNNSNSNDDFSSTKSNPKYPKTTHVQQCSKARSAHSQQTCESSRIAAIEDCALAALQGSPSSAQSIPSCRMLSHVLIEADPSFWDINHEWSRLLTSELGTPTLNHPYMSIQCGTEQQHVTTWDHFRRMLCILYPYIIMHVLLPAVYLLHLFHLMNVNIQHTTTHDNIIWKRP